MSGAIKNDSGKADLSLLPRVALVRFAEAMQVGQVKYGRYNYCKGMEASRQIAAMLRHAVAWFEGEEFDKDGQHHLGSVMANAAMILRQQELGTLQDDRYKASPTPQLVYDPVLAEAEKVQFVPPADSEETYEIVVTDNRKKSMVVETHADPLIAERRLEELRPQWPTFQIKLRVVTTREYPQAS